MFASKAQMKDLDRLKKRSDFLRVQKQGKKWVAKGLILQLADNGTDRRRLGITVTKRLDKSAVARNRMKRRLRAAAYDILPVNAKKGVDYILIGRADTATRGYKDLQNDLKWCLGKLGYLSDRAEKEN